MSCPARFAGPGTHRTMRACDARVNQAPRCGAWDCAFGGAEAQRKTSGAAIVAVRPTAGPLGSIEGGRSPVALSREDIGVFHTRPRSLRASPYTRRRARVRTSVAAED